jgi:hypothetical protein
MSDFWIDALGWLGGLMVVVAYFLISSGKVKSDAVSFQFLNLVGSIFLIINTYEKGAYPSTVVNIIWVGIALFGFYRIWADKTRT